MGYLHINNLYKDQRILLFKKCYALEKIHGTSAHLKWTYYPDSQSKQLVYFSGGEKYDKFIQLFNNEKLMQKFEELFPTTSIIIYGEAYGGKQQGMSNTYGKELKFIVFDIKINEKWLNVPDAEQICNQLGLEFVPYEEVETDPKLLDELSWKNSIQALRNGMGDIHLREGIVLRPLIEMLANDGERIIAKHKNDKFKEREHPPKLKVGQTLEILKQAQQIAQEWVTEMRLTHILNKFPNKIKFTGEIIKNMIEDIVREGEGEIEFTKEVKTAIGKRTALLFKERLKEAIK